MKKTELTEGWTLSAVEATGRAAELPQAIPATVPGTVHTDLLAAGLIADPYRDLNELADQWIGHTTWVYRTTVEGAAASGDRSALVFEGLDTIATVTLNGEVLGRTYNQHRTYRFDVTDRLHPGTNDLEVRFDSAWDYAAKMQDDRPLPNAYPTASNFIRKMACNFGWDWGPQLVTAGIWKAARLETWSTARLAEVRPQITVDGGSGHVRIDALVEQTDAAAPLLLAVALGDHWVVTTVEGGRALAELTVDDVELWWPAGLGEQPLYDLTVTLGDGLDTWSRRVGFRTVELDTSEDESGSRFTFVVNGIPLFIRGANWIPDDCFPSRVTRERYRERISQAVGANMNLLRVWGGGIFERDEFYETCDELGVLTWQDFLFACAAYPEEEPFRSEVEAEARDNVVRLSGHPSLVLWNGNNENIWGWFDWDWQESIGDRTWGLGFYTGLLPSIVAELDPATPYWPGSPFSGSMEFDANDLSRGNSHLWDVWNRLDYATYATYEPRFVSEFGFQGPPTWSTLTRALHDRPLTPESEGMLLHQKAEDGNGKLARGLAPHLPEPHGIEQWHYLTQLNQARAVEFGISRFRSQRPHCMGTIVWQLNDCWPVTSWAAVDGYGSRKPLWHAIKRAYAPRFATLQPGALHLVNDSREQWHFSGAITRRTLDGTPLETQPVDVTIEPQSLTVVPVALSGPADAAAEGLFVESDGRLVGTRFFVEDKDLRLLAGPVAVEVGEWVGGVTAVTLRAEVVVRGGILEVDRLDAAAWASDADLTIVPGLPVALEVHSDAPLREIPSVLTTLNPLVATVPTP